MSYIVITCRDGADPDCNRLLLRTPVGKSGVPSYIKLQGGTNKLDISNHPDLKYGFYNAGCDSELDFWEASENCQDIIEIDLRNFDGSEMTTMDSMFYYMFNLERIYFGGLDTSRVTDMSYAFNGVGRYVKGDSSSDSMKNWEESDAEPGFYIKCSLRNFILSNLNVEKVEKFEYLFEYSTPVLCNAASRPTFRLIFDSWKLMSPKVAINMFVGVDYLTTMSLQSCNSDTQDTIIDEWLYYMTSRIIR